MPTGFSAFQVGLITFEALAALAGLAVWWHFQFSAGAREVTRRQLRPWLLPLSGFAMMILVVLGGAAAGGGLARLALAALPPHLAADSGFSMILANAGLHLGVLGSILVCVRMESFLLLDTPARFDVEPGPIAKGKIAPAGVLTFAATLSMLLVVAFVWKWLLEVMGIPAEKQDLIDIFATTTDPVKLVTMSLVAVVLAPLTEELTFRAGLFRFLRDRMPRWAAHAIPAAAFAALHQNLAVLLPLFALGVVFSLAYERTGRIWVTVLAHGLFNLNTIALILAKLDV